MSEIEVYQKITTAIEGCETAEVLFALDFVRQKLQRDESLKYQAQCTQLAGANTIVSMEAYRLQQEAAEKRAADIVRNVVREELANSNKPAEKGEAA